VGPGLARNLAAREARGRALVFLDSDCVVLEGWLAGLLAPLADEGVGAAGGAEAPDEAEPLLARVFHVVLTSPLTTGGLRGARRAAYRPRTFSMAVRRDAFERAGGFAELSNGEDLDLGQRIARLGLALEYAPASRVHHRRRRALGGLFRQTLAMGRARTVLVRRDRAHASALAFAPAIALALGAALSIAAAASPAARPLALGAAGIAASYLALVGAAAALALREPLALGLAPLAFALAQAGYAAGLIAGALAPAPLPPPGGANACSSASASGEGVNDRSPAGGPAGAPASRSGATGGSPPARDVDAGLNERSFSALAAPPGARA
jgi:hypothetical protein